MIFRKLSKFIKLVSRFQQQASSVIGLQRRQSSHSRPKKLKQSPNNSGILNTSGSALSGKVNIMEKV